MNWHTSRGMTLVNCLQSVVEVLLFYHPAVWWLSRKVRQEREICCDATAAEMCGDRILYSRALLSLEESRQEFALAATGGDEVSYRAPAAAVGCTIESRS